MKIPKEILDYGVTLDIIKEAHAKTKLGQFEFDEIEFVKSNNEFILIRLRLIIPNRNFREGMNESWRVKLRKVVIEITVSKMRDKKINKILEP